MVEKKTTIDTTNCPQIIKTAGRKTLEPDKPVPHYVGLLFESDGSYCKVVRIANPHDVEGILVAELYAGQSVSSMNSLLLAAMLLAQGRIEEARKISDHCGWCFHDPCDEGCRVHQLERENAALRAKKE